MLQDRDIFCVYIYTAINKYKYNFFTCFAEAEVNSSLALYGLSPRYFAVLCCIPYLRPSDLMQNL